jgi:hypothetical protein
VPDILGPGGEPLRRTEQQAKSVGAAIERHMQRALSAAAVHFHNLGTEAGAAFQGMLGDIQQLAVGAAPASKEGADRIRSHFLNAMAALPEGMRKNMIPHLKKVLQESSGYFQKYGIETTHMVQDFEKVKQSTSAGAVTNQFFRLERLKAIGKEHGVADADLAKFSAQAWSQGTEGILDDLQKRKNEVDLMVRSGSISEKTGAELTRDLNAQQVKHVKRTTGEITRAKELAGEYEKKTANTTMSQIIESDKGILGSALRSMTQRGSLVSSVVDKEQRAAKGLPVIYSAGEKVAQAGVAGLAKILTSVGPAIAAIGAAALSVEMVLDLVDRGRKVGALGFAVDFQRAGTAGSAGIMKFYNTAAEVFQGTRDLREMAAIQGINLDKMNIASLQNLLGLQRRGSKESTGAWVRAFSSIAAQAPLVGLSAAEGIDFATRAQRAFGTDTKKTEAVLMNFMNLGKRAGMTFKEFAAQIGDLDSMGAEFGAKGAAGIIGALSQMAAGFAGTQAQAGMLESITKNIAAAPLMTSIAMSMAAGSSFSAAASKAQSSLRESDGTYGPMNIMNFSAMLKKFVPAGRGAEGDVMAAQFVEQFTGRRGAAAGLMASPEMMNKLRKGEIDMSKLHEILDKNIDPNVERDSFRVLATQNGILDQILGAMRELMLGLADSWIMRSDARERLRAASGDRESGALLIESAINLGSGKRK